MFDLIATSIPGCFEIRPRIVEDKRGRFVKVFHLEAFRALGLESAFLEDYYSTSCEGVLRGMHFQRPPADHAKMVYCIDGAAMDVVLDLRRGSPAYGRPISIELSRERANLLYLPRGCAHGFYVRSKRATLNYKVTSVYSQEHDDGILWNSIDFHWPSPAPIVSERDALLRPLNKFDTPFSYE